MLAGAGGLIAALVGIQQLGVWDRVDHPAWNSDLVRLAQAQQSLSRGQVELRISFYQYQLTQANAALANNRLAQYGYTSTRRALPSVLIEQESALRASIADLQSRIASDQALLLSGAAR